MESQLEAFFEEPLEHRPHHLRHAGCTGSSSRNVEPFGVEPGWSAQNLGSAPADFQSGERTERAADQRPQRHTG